MRQVAEWPQAVAELHRITKPGGWVQMTEPDGQIRSLQGTTPTIQDWNDRGL
jgi:predicted SAM-dependent methyltransferase